MKNKAAYRVAWASSSMYSLLLAAAERRGSLGDDVQHEDQGQDGQDEGGQLCPGGQPLQQDHGPQFLERDGGRMDNMRRIIFPMMLLPS